MMSGWQPIETAPKDELIDLWCVPPTDSDFSPEDGGIRLTDCSWHEADNIFPKTGWVRVLDDGYWDIVEGAAASSFGLPTWVPTHWQPRPEPPTLNKEE